jgi:hypothetical protein
MKSKVAKTASIPAFEAENAACDRCPARATHRVALESGILDFCTHHFAENEVKLVFKALGILTRAINE